MDKLFPLLHELRGSRRPFSPLVDEAALLVAERCRTAIGYKLGLALTLDQWGQMSEVLKNQIAIALRHAAFDKPDFPDNRFEEGTL